MSASEWSLPPYPLGEVLDVKKRRVDRAEKVVQEKQKLLEDEQKKLKECEEARDKVKHHYQDKLQQLRQELDGGTTSTRIERFKVYIKIVQEKLQVEEKKVKQQKAQVEVAEKNLKLAQEELKQRRKEQDKIETHKKEWTKETTREIQFLETKKMDELGSEMFLSRFSRLKNE